MKRRRIPCLAGLCIMLTLCLGGCGAEQEASIDVFHCQVGNLTIDVTPPDSWPETSSVYGVHYDPLDMDLLEAALGQPVTQEVEDISDEQDGTVFKTWLHGADGYVWAYTESEISRRYVYTEDNGVRVIEEFGTEISLKDEDLLEAKGTADAFLQDIGITGTALTWAVSTSDGTYRLFYDPWELELPVMAHQYLYGAPGNIEVDISASQVCYVDISQYSMITGEAETGEIISPTEAAEALIEWYEESGKNYTYEFTELSLRYSVDSKDVIDSEDCFTGTARPCWIFYWFGTDEFGLPESQSIGVDALTGEVCK